MANNQQNESGFNEDILSTTALIHRKHPELSKYLDEMTITIPDMNDPVISHQLLFDYNETLRVMLNKYTPGHRPDTKRRP